MSMTRAALAAVLAALMLGCGASPPEVPPTGVDLDTPVMDLPGWDELIASLVLAYNHDQALANWVEVFRQGLDIARQTQDPIERQQNEAEWWRESRRSLVTIVGADQVDAVIAWLEMLYGNRGGGS